MPKAKEEKIYSAAPETPGVYLMKNALGEIIYVGKAANLKRRVSSYFQRPHDFRIQRMVSEIRSIEYRPTDTAIEALILESQLIKKLEPSYNVREKDNKSFLVVEITKDKFPRVLLVRNKDGAQGRRFGPFTSASSIRETLRILRRIFPWSVHDPKEIGKFERPCFDAQIGLCPGTCVGGADRGEYIRNIRNLKLFFEGRKKQIIGHLEKEMKTAAKTMEFEKAEKIKRQLFALRHIHDVALIKEDEISAIEERPFRIEGYDISNISGTSSVGSMVVFSGGRPDKSSYRKFKIKTIEGTDDFGMMREVIGRRLKNDWPLPDLMLIDGGIGQVNAARSVLTDMKIDIPVVGIAKGPERKRNDVVGTVPKGTDLNTLIKVRDEAHRFAISYHRQLRSRTSGILRNKT